MNEQDAKDSAVLTAAKIGIQILFLPITIHAKIIWELTKPKDKQQENSK